MRLLLGWNDRRTFASLSRCAKNTLFVSRWHEARVTITREIFPALIGTHSRDTGNRMRYAFYHNEFKRFEPSGWRASLADVCPSVSNPDYLPYHRIVHCQYPRQL